jgi:glycosyltransferase involved in cell wall biosynthesis
LRILLAHNQYQIAGGEDAVVRQEMSMLRDSGADVHLFAVDNSTIVGPSAKLKTAAQVIYSWTMRERIAKVIEGLSPDLIHVHNFFPLISPSVYDAAAHFGCPVVQTLHNYRLLCANATLYREGHICHDCLDRKFGWPALAHGCYKNSRVGSAPVAAMLAIHRFRGTWSSKVHRYIVLTDFARNLFVANTDIPAHKLVVKPNAVRDFGRGDGLGEYVLFVGRLTPEKGIFPLLEAARRGLSLPLKIAGTGPLLSEVEAAHKSGYLTCLGEQQPEQVTVLMKHASMLIIPSLWYEGLPVVVPEAFSTGLPILASRIGSLSTLITHERNGLHFEPGSSQELCDAIHRVFADPVLRQSMRVGARIEYEKLYRPANNAAVLHTIYESAIAEHQMAEGAPFGRSFVNCSDEAIETTSDGASGE